MKATYKYRDTDITTAAVLYVSSDIYTISTRMITVSVEDLPSGAVKVAAAQSGIIQINAPVKWYGSETTDITGRTAILTTNVSVNGGNIKRNNNNYITLVVSALNSEGNVIESVEFTLRVIERTYSDVTETAVIASGATRLPVQTTCNTLTITPALSNVISGSLTYEILSYGNIEDISSVYNSTTNTVTVYSCPLFYSNRYEAKYQSTEQYVNFELAVRFYAISSVTGKEVTGNIIYYMPVNYTYYQDIIINSPVKVNYDIDNISVTPSFTTDYVFKSVSVIKTGAVTGAVKSGNSVLVSTKEAAAATRAVIRFVFTSEVFEPYTFYYDIDVIKQGAPDFIVFNSSVNRTEQIAAQTKWSAHIGTSSDSIAAGKLVPINGAARLMLGNICVLSYPAINIAPVMSDDSEHSIMWENMPVAQSNTEYRIDTDASTLWYAPRWDADATDAVYIELSSNKLYRNTPFYITYNIGRKNNVSSISLTVYTVNNGIKKSVWVKKSMTFDYGVTHVAYNYYGQGENLVFEWAVTLADGDSYSITETADLEDTCKHPYIVYWTGAAGCVKQVGLNDASKEKVSAAFETMATPYFAAGTCSTRQISKKWKSENGTTIAAVTDYLSSAEMTELSSLFASLSAYVYDAEKQSMKPVTVTDKSFTINTFVNNGRKYANASFNIEYSEKQTVFN